MLKWNENKVFLKGESHCMRIELLSKGTCFKANLHCHTTDSDGCLTPKEIKDLYVSHGYSVIAFTDHIFMADHSDLNDDHFLALKGYENVVSDLKKDFHFNLYATDSQMTGLVGITDYGYRWFQSHKPLEQQKKIILPSGFCAPDYSIGNVNKIIAEANASGFLVAYNHPVWSLQNHEDYLGLKGLWAMEIYNHGCFMEGYDEQNPYIYDQMLKDGQRLFCTANDDNHNYRPDFDIFGGFNVIRADRLDYPTIISALKTGRFYASTGAFIESLTYEDGKFILKTAHARSVAMSTDVRFADRVYGENVTEAVFSTDPQCHYYRFVVEDDHGYRAYTRAYFTEELK
jgi:hypothetical protein